jgi:hypothetical protein
MRAPITHPYSYSDCPQGNEHTDEQKYLTCQWDPFRCALLWLSCLNSGGPLLSRKGSHTKLKEERVTGTQQQAAQRGIIQQKHSPK